MDDLSDKFSKKCFEHRQLTSISLYGKRQCNGVFMRVLTCFIRMLSQLLGSIVSNKYFSHIWYFHKRLPLSRIEPREITYFIEATIVPQLVKNKVQNVQSGVDLLLQNIVKVEWIRLLIILNYHKYGVHPYEGHHKY